MWDIVSCRRWGVRCRGKSTSCGQQRYSSCLTGTMGQYTKSHIANFASTRTRKTRHILKLKRRIIAEEDLRRILYRSAACIHELLEKHLAEYPIGLFPEDGAENHRHSVVAGFDVDGFLFSVMYRHHLASLSDPFRRRLGRKFRRLLLQPGGFVEGALKRRCHGVPL